MTFFHITYCYVRWKLHLLNKGDTLEIHSSPFVGNPIFVTLFSYPTNSHPLIDTTLYTPFGALQGIFNIFAIY